MLDMYFIVHELLHFYVPLCVRCGSVQTGDRILAINDIRTEGLTVEDAMHLLHSPEDIIKIKLRREEHPNGRGSLQIIMWFKFSSNSFANYCVKYSTLPPVQLTQNNIQIQVIVLKSSLQLCCKKHFSSTLDTLLYYCGIIFIHRGQCLWVDKIFSICGDVISLVHVSSSIL